MTPSSLVKKCSSVVEVLGSKFPQYLSISTDSRNLAGSNAFVCLQGPNFDGHQFIEEVIDKGVRVIFASDPAACARIKNKKISLVLVKDTLRFMQELAGLRSREWQKSGGILLALTGSSGKTTCKEMLAHLLDSILPGQVHFTQGNFNNHIGVPLTILHLKDTHSLAVLEMGTNHAGEIKELCRIAHPAAGMITNIGSAHLEFLQSLDGVYREKKALFEWVAQRSDRKSFVICSDDPYLANLKKEDSWVTCFGSKGDYHFLREKNCITLKSDQSEYRICNNFIHGQHNFINLAQTFLLAVTLFPQKVELLQKAGEQWRPILKNRGLWHQLAGGTRVFLDAYNANPDSVKASLQGFSEEVQDFAREDILLVLGDMRELGEQSAQLHLDLGLYVKRQNYPNLIFIGKEGSI